MSVKNLIFAAAGQVGGEYQISRSLRFNSADSAYLSRTPASASNRKTWTFSAWVKRSKLGTSNAIVFGSGDTYVNFETDRFAVNLRPSSTNYLGISTAKFRDPSAWYHIVAAVDTTQATAADRLKMWVNNQLITAFDTSTYLDIPVNTDTAVNSTNAHNIGRYTGTGEHFDGYIADAHFIDGQALTPTSFGEINPTTGVWSPIEYTGSYGTNGFYLNFSDNSGVTSTTLGKDQAGSNNWTPSGSPGFSVAAGAGNDSLVDTPTRFGTDTGAGGEVRGNYCTLNPLFATGTVSNGNLEHRATADAWVNASGSIFVTNGKWYFEGTNVAGNFTMIGVATNSASAATDYSTNTVTWTYYINGNKFGNGSSSAGVAYGASYTTNDVIGVALDMDAGEITFYKNGVSQGVAFNTGLSGLAVCPWCGSYTNNNGWNMNFGQRPFAYTAPSGFKALVTTNLPDPTVVQGGDYFNTVLYTGTGSSLGVTGVGFQPDFVWIKERNGAADHGLYDAVRGTTKQLESNLDTAETTEATGLTAFGSDGFTVGALAQLNTSTDTYVAWNWKANGAGVSNTAGTISSTVSVSTTSGFSIVTYTGNNTAGATVGHGLGAVPRMIIVKNRDQADPWQVYHAANTANPETDYLVLNASSATTDALNRWNDTLPTSSVFSIGDAVEVNSNTEGYVAYCFTSINGFSAFGSYTGNGSTDGAFVYTGFRPAWIMVKNTASITNWFIWDDKRNAYNPAETVLLANTDTTDTLSRDIDILSNGFKCRKNDQNYNESGSVMIYAAFAENPVKFSLAR